MAQRNVQLDIKVNGTDQITDVNKALEETSINAAQSAESALKLTKGIAAGFQLASSAASAFGEKNAEAFQKTIAKATEYVAISTALKDAAEGFGAANVKSLVETFKGFTKAGIGAKLFGTTTKAAITSTGIGALVVALGLLIANWDAVTEAVGGFIDSIPFLKSIKDTVNELIERVGSLANLFKAVGAFISAAFTAGADASDAFNKSLEDSKAADALDETLKAQEKINKELDRSIELLKAQGGEEQKIFDLRRANLNENIALLEKKNNKTDEEIDKLEDYKQKLKLLDIEEKKFRLNQTKASLDAIANSEKEAKAKAENELKALEEREKTQLAIERELQDQRLKLINDEEERALKTRAEATVRFIEDTTKKYEEGKKKNLITEKQYNELIENEQKLLEKDLDKIVSDAQKKRDIETQQRLLKNVSTLRDNIDYILRDNKDNLLDQLLIGGKEQAPADFIVAQLNRIKSNISDIKDTELLGEKQLEFGRWVEDLNDELFLTKVQFQEIDGVFEIIITKGKLFSEAWREQNAETFSQISEYAGLAGELIDSLFSRQSFLIQQNLNQIAEDTERVNNQYTEAVNNQRALEDELLTAQGARREEILNSLDRERNKEKQLAAEREKLRRAEIDQKNKQQKIEYANAVTQSAIAAAQAVLAALATAPPASFAFAAVAAAISAIQTGIVIANKPKPLTYAQGGFTQGLGQVDHTGHEVAGVVHANEYVVPAKVLNSESGYRMVAALEAMRQGKPAFADGGLTTPTITGTETSSGTEALMAALQGLNLTVGVTEINTVQNRVQLIEQRASI